VGLRAKLAEIDELMTRERQRIVYEFHPEVSFCEMNGGKPLMFNKKSDDGQRERIAALRRSGFDERILLSMEALRSGRDDFLDACAGLWTAERIYQHRAARFPGHEEREYDARCLDVAIWY
jgi:predicted RNase H-like nuclease